MNIKHIKEEFRNELGKVEKKMTRIMKEKMRSSEGQSGREAGRAMDRT
jgi:hypothetical protein